MKNRNLLAAILGTVMVVAGTSRARGDDVSPLRLSVNLLEAEPAATNGRSVAEGTKVRLRVYGIFAEADGNVKWGDRVPGIKSDLDLADTLGMDLETFTGGFQISLNFGAEGRFHVDAAYDGYYDFDGSRTVGSISVDGVTYTGRVDSSLSLHAGLLNLGYDFIHQDRFTVTGNAGVRIFNIDASIKQALLGTNESFNVWAPIPTLGVGARFNVTENLYISGNVAGMWLGGYGSYYELGAEVGYDINRNVGVFIGYRWWALDVEWDSDVVDITIGGLYAGVEVRI